MACLQAVVFCLPATQKKVHGAWLAQPCLSELKREEYLGPKDPQLTQDYQEVQQEKTITLAIVLQWCTMWARAPQGIFCWAVQELYKCLVPLVEEDDWFHMEKEIQEGFRKDPMVATTPTGVPILEKAPSPKGVPLQMARTKKLPCSTSLDPPSVPILEGVVPPQDLALVPSQWSPPPLAFLPGPGAPHLPPLEDAYLPGTITLFDFSTLELLEMTISHIPVMGKVHYCLQTWSHTRISLLSMSSLRHLEPSPKVQEL